MLTYNGQTVTDIRYGDIPIKKMLCAWERDEATMNAYFDIVCDVNMASTSCFSKDDQALLAKSYYDEGGERHYLFRVKPSDANTTVFKMTGTQYTKVKIHSMPANRFKSLSKFFYGSSATSIDLSGFNTTGVTDLKHLFYKCSNLTSIDLSGLDLSAYPNIGGMFDYCTRLTKIVLGTDFGRYMPSSFDISGSPWGMGSAEAAQSVRTSLLDNLYDRAANGKSVSTFFLHGRTKATLTTSEKAAITAKGYTIA